MKPLLKYLYLVLYGSLLYAFSTSVITYLIGIAAFSAAFLCGYHSDEIKSLLRKYRLFDLGPPKP